MITLLFALTWIQVPTEEAPVGIVEDNGTFYVVMTKDAAKEYAMAYDKAEAYKHIIEVQETMLNTIQTAYEQMTYTRREMYLIASIQVLAMMISFAYGLWLSTQVTK